MQIIIPVREWESERDRRIVHAGVSEKEREGERELENSSTLIFRNRGVQRLHCHRAIERFHSMSI